MRIPAIAASALALLLPAAIGAADRREPTPLPAEQAPYPEAARRKDVEGNVVLTGEITALGTVQGLRALASSSPLLTGAAVSEVSRWRFRPAMEDGRPTAVMLNAVVRFRRVRGAPLPAPTAVAAVVPMVGNLEVRPGDASGAPTGPEGFSIEPGDGGVRAVLDLDLPGGARSRSLRVIVTDRFPGGREVSVLDRPVPAGAARALWTFVFHRTIDPTAADEQGIHTLEVAVDGRVAGGARYRVDGRARGALAAGR
jgi:TonB family protein